MQDESIKLPYARKHRPATLKGYIGNDKVKEQALSRINGENRPQVILVDGASGCGKTTFGRIVAKEYLCEHRSPTEGACGVCDSCIELNEYITSGSTDSLLNLKEIDIADNSGKKDVGAFLADVDAPAYGGGWKVYLLDEVHQALPQTQNMLLKLLEEPPEKVLFILCTTDPDRLLDTVLNRCQLILHVKKPTVKELGGLLKDICIKENEPYDLKGLYLVASRSELTIRKALNTLEQIISEKHSATYTSVLESLDELADSELFNFFRKLLNNDIMGYVSALHKIKTRMELRIFVSNLIDFTTRGIYILNNIEIDGLTDTELKSYNKLFSQFSVEEISTLITKLLDLRATDIETKLLLMGYTGLKSKRSATVEEEKPNALEVDFFPDELADEHKASTNNALERMNPSEEQQADRINELTKKGSYDDVMNMFGAVVAKDDGGFDGIVESNSVAKVGGEE